MKSKSQNDLIALNKALRKANIELKRMDTYKNEFISVTAHELKTPLSTIHGFSSLLQNPAIGGKKKQREYYLSIIMQDADRLKKLIDDILDLSRLDIGTMKFFFEKTNIRDLLKLLVKNYYTHVKEHGLVISADVDSKVPQSIEVDKDRLMQVLSNLINNAIKYSPKKGSVISINVKKKDNELLFSVKDQGIGIAKTHLPKLFERFYQADLSFTRKVGGTGLGLAICRSIVRAMGGEISVSSGVGKGSEFSFNLPLKAKSKGKKELSVFQQSEKTDVVALNKDEIIGFLEGQGYNVSKIEKK